MKQNIKKQSEVKITVDTQELKTNASAGKIRIR